MTTGHQRASDREIGRTPAAPSHFLEMQFRRIGRRTGERGVTSIEYALIGSLLSIAIIAALLLVSGKVVAMFDAVANAF